MEKIKVKCTHLSQVGRLETDYEGVTLDAVRAVLERADLGRVSRIYIASYAPAELCAISDPFRLLTQSIQREFPRLRAAYHGIFKTGGDALYRALTSMREEGPAVGDVVVVGSEKMTHLDPGEVAGVLSARENAHDRAYGATLPSLGALVTRSYLRDRGVPEEALHLVALKNHRNGAKNPRAQFQGAVTLDEIASSPLVADPLRRMHCAPISDGAAAVLLGFDEGRVEFLGWGMGADTPLFQERRDIGRFIATAAAGEAALAASGMVIGDIDVVEIHDAFSSFELINLEEMGFFPLGEAWKALRSGELDIGGTVAVNPSGGMKARGHPIGAAGVSSTVEIHDQLLGAAGERQHPGAAVGMVQSAGGVSKESYAFVLGRCGGRSEP